MVCRDLGGTVTKDDRWIADHCLYRSRNLHKLRRKELAEIADLGIAKIIDLRTEEEMLQRMDQPIAGAEYLHIPIFREHTFGITHEKRQNIRQAIANMPDMEELYRRIVTDPECIAQLRKVIHEIVESERFPVLYHCTGGRDRTGIVTMLLLSILDVGEEIILLDYMLAHDYSRMSPRMVTVMTMLLTKDPVVAARIKRRFEGDPQFLISAMDAIKEQYGSMDAYIQNQLAVSASMKEAFQARVLKKGV